MKRGHNAVSQTPARGGARNRTGLRPTSTSPTRDSSCPCRRPRAGCWLGREDDPACPHPVGIPVVLTRPDVGPRKVNVVSARFSVKLG
jgi:hypothetical protein